jgi:hypothetical protein
MDGRKGMINNGINGNGMQFNKHFVDIQKFYSTAYLLRCGDNQSTNSVPIALFFLLLIYVSKIIDDIERL